MQAFEAPAKWFFGEFLPEGEAQEVKSDLAPLGVWANEMAQKKDVLAQVSLARACHVASAKFRRACATRPRPARRPRSRWARP